VIYFVAIGCSATNKVNNKSDKWNLTLKPREQYCYDARGDGWLTSK